MDPTEILHHAWEALNFQEENPKMVVPRHLYQQDPEACEELARMYGFSGVKISDPLPTSEQP